MAGRLLRLVVRARSEAAWLWLFLIFISQFPIYYLMFRLFELEQRLWGIALYVVAVIILVPPFVASRRQLKARQDQEAER